MTSTNKTLYVVPVPPSVNVMALEKEFVIEHISTSTRFLYMWLTDDDILMLKLKYGLKVVKYRYEYQLKKPL